LPRNLEPVERQVFGWLAQLGRTASEKPTAWLRLGATGLTMSLDGQTPEEHQL